MTTSRGSRNCALLILFNAGVGRLNSRRRRPHAHFYHSCHDCHHGKWVVYIGGLLKDFALHFWIWRTQAANRRGPCNRISQRRGKAVMAGQETRCRLEFKFPVAAEVFSTGKPVTDVALASRVAFGVEWLLWGTW